MCDLALGLMGLSALSFIHGTSTGACKSKYQCNDFSVNNKKKMKIVSLFLLSEKIIRTRQKEYFITGGMVERAEQTPTLQTELEN